MGGSCNNLQTPPASPRTAPPPPPDITTWLGLGVQGRTQDTPGVLTRGGDRPSGPAGKCSKSCPWLTEAADGTYEKTRFRWAALTLVGRSAFFNVECCVRERGRPARRPGTALCLREDGGPARRLAFGRLHLGVEME